MKKKPSEVTIKKVDLGEFEVRISEANIVFENKAKSWQVKYDITSPYYDHILSIVMNDMIELLGTIVRSLFSANMAITDISGFIITKQFEAIDEFTKLYSKKATDEENAEALEEVKNLHKEETTDESIS